MNMHGFLWPSASSSTRFGQCVRNQLPRSSSRAPSSMASSISRIVADSRISRLRHSRLETMRVMRG